MSDEKPKPPEPIQVQEGRVCANCVWWHVKTGYEYQGGACRKREPMVTFFMIGTDKYSEHNNAAEWPQTTKDDWCGQFGSKPPAFIKEEVKEAPQHAP